jgi:divalent metal cation (Fe/Co/Zn/Cd) transporter
MRFVTKTEQTNGNGAGRADATESALCAYLSWIALVGIRLNAIWHIEWADAAAALIIIPLIVREGLQSMRTRVRLLLSVPRPQLSRFPLAQLTRAHPKRTDRNTADAYQRLGPRIRAAVVQILRRL